MSKKEEAQLPSEVSAELEGKVAELKQLINIHDLLNRGHFEGFMNVRIGEALDYVSKLHASVLEEVESDPQAHLIPNLKGESNDN